MTYCKKLIEVALPLEAINVASAREKSIRHGHPSTLHLWWARRPLAACRAVLFSSLVDDPGEYIADTKAAHAERERLFRLIEKMVLWENSNNEKVLDQARLEIAHSVARNLGVDVPVGKEAIREFLAEKAPPVLDPFAGGGSIPLEAQRLGLRAYASDLNPVAVLINKALIEIPPRFANLPPVHPPEPSAPLTLTKREWHGAEGLAEDVRYYGKWMRDEAEKRIGHFYPKVNLPKEYGGGEATVIAWLWARTVKCPNPACGATMPLVRSFALATKKGKEAWIDPVVDKVNRTVSFEARTGKSAVPECTITRHGARCIVCGSVVQLEYIRAEGQAGRMGTQMMALVGDGGRNRIYLSPTKQQISAALQAHAAWIPDQELQGKCRVSLPLYGMDTFGDLFTMRQLLAMTTFSELVEGAGEKLLRDAVNAGMKDDNASFESGRAGARAYADAVATYLGEAVSKLTTFHNTLAYWRSKENKSATGFGRQALAMTWDFTETNPFAGAGGDFEEIVAGAAPKVIAGLPSFPSATVKQADATELETNIRPLISTDPPYYDNVCYADLSDFFYIWLRLSLARIYPGLFGTMLTPKAQELIASPYRFPNREEAQNFFEQGLENVFGRVREVQDSRFPFTVYYAFKQSETEENEGDDEIRRLQSRQWHLLGG